APRVHLPERIRLERRSFVTPLAAADNCKIFQNFSSLRLKRPRQIGPDVYHDLELLNVVVTFGLVLDIQRLDTGNQLVKQFGVVQSHVHSFVQESIFCPKFLHLSTKRAGPVGPAQHNITSRSGPWSVRAEQQTA
ncbi:hypothetical protein P0E77_14560, partial [Enterococcus faecalis]|uniref:hypothetical protein n=1 Tax=Enterococcus faecalis TaxID=1351 RepID=UPI0025B00019